MRKAKLPGALLAAAIAVSLGAMTATPHTVSAQSLPPCPAPGNRVLTESCELTRDYTVPPGQHGYVIGADGVIIDGCGHAITGNRSNCGEDCTCGILNYDDGQEYGYDNVTVKNLEIEQFCNGIVIKGKPGHKVKHNRIEKCLIHDNGAEGSCEEGAAWTHAIYLSAVDESVITQCEVSRNTGCDDSSCEAGGMAIYLKYGCEHNSITCNYIHDNAHSGIYTKMKCMYNDVSYNHIVRNGRLDALAPCGGIVMRCKVSNGWTIEKNSIEDNYGPGIFLGGGKNILRSNTITGSKRKTPEDADIPGGYGIDMGRSDGSFNNELYGNCVCNNEDGDIRVYGVAPNPEKANTGDKNCCATTENYEDSSAASGCAYSCDKLTAIYYDYDGDGDCSAEPENCSCNGAGCIPGKFAEAGLDEHCLEYGCSDTPGTDGNDCAAAISGDVESPVQPASNGSGFPTVLVIAILIVLAGSGAYIRVKQRGKSRTKT